MTISILEIHHELEMTYRLPWDGCEAHVSVLCKEHSMIAHKNRGFIFLVSLLITYPTVLSLCTLLASPSSTLADLIKSATSFHPLSHLDEALSLLKNQIFYVLSLHLKHAI